MEGLPKGRGAALLKRLQEVQGKVGQPAEEAPASSPGLTSGMGRGLRLQQHLEALASKQETAPPPAPTVPRGRAALTQKLLELNKLSELKLEQTQQQHQEVLKATQPLETEPVRTEAVTYQGTDGSIVPATANYIKLAVETGKGVFEYDVSFNPEVDNTSFRIKLLNSQLDKLGGIKSFDGGHCLYLPIQLDCSPFNLDAAHPVTGENVNIKIVFKKKKHLGESVHLFNVLFNRIMKKLCYYQFNRNYFDVNNPISVPQHKLEVLPGYVTRVDEFEGGLLLCLDSHHKVLRTQTVLDLLVELSEMHKDRFKREAEEAILGALILTRYNNRTYRIDDILWDASPSGTFETSNGKKITYIDYYKMQHGLEIKDRNQPLLLHRKSIRVPGSLEKEDRLICLIPELCYLTGLTDKMRNDFRVMKSIAEYTRLTPRARLHSLQKFVSNVTNNRDASNVLKEWGLRIEDVTVDVNIRLLNPEQIYFGNNASYQTDRKADWNAPLAKFQVCGPVNLMDWTVIYVHKDEMNAMDFSTTMTRLGSSMGCAIQKPHLKKVPNDRTATFVEACNNAITSTSQCLVFIMPAMRTDVYSSIKKICCLKTPIASQMILSRTLANKKRFRNIVQKIALQINCKLGGTLWSLKIPVRTWMICGIDIYHGKGSTTSVCGFVASLNDTFTRWYSLAFTQSQEISDHLKAALAQTLEKRREIEGTFPTHIIFYRDGVGDGQLQHCLDYEVAQLTDCLKQLNLDVKLTFIVVQKRINTRIFLKQNVDENPPPGTILDHTVTRYKYRDFFLVSQHVTQGTVTPTHYIVLCDNANLKVDHVQKLTYKLCHLYYNWAGTIRVPAPCQYAHKLAYLVGQHIGKIPSETMASRLYYL